MIVTLGTTVANIKIDDVEREVPIVVVKDDQQEFDLLVGRPYTESPKTYVVKTSDSMKFFNEEESL